MAWRNRFVKRFIGHVPKTVLLKAAVEAGFEVPVDITKAELHKLWHDMLKH